LKKKILKIWQRKNDKKFSCLRFENEQEHLEYCDLLYGLGIAELEPSEIDIVKKKIATAWASKDAALLYDKWYFGGGSILGKQIPCTDIKGLRGPTDLMNPTQSFMGRMSKPSGWSDERYKAATQKLATWDMDFEWTIAQHEAGSRAGANMCKNNAKKNPFSDERRECLKTAFPDYSAPIKIKNSAQPEGTSR
jgi:hypothetical protein